MKKHILKDIIEKLQKTSVISYFLIMLMNVKTYAASTIGTQEVETATQNIKDAVIKLAMPIRKCINVCKHCNNCNQINSKC